MREYLPNGQFGQHQVQPVAALDPSLDHASWDGEGAMPAGPFERLSGVASRMKTLIRAFRFAS
jgi:hypothetical protein